MLEVIELHKRYNDIAALCGTNLIVTPGQLLGFLGPNGAGKTTTMRSIFGLVRPDSGQLLWDGKVIDQDQRLRFGYMPEERGLYPRMKCLDQLIYFGMLHGLPFQLAKLRSVALLDRFGLADRAESRLEDLSHGNQQRVQLAVPLVHKPQLLVLDEPFAGLDPLGVAAMADILAEQAAAGSAVMFSSHQLDLVADMCEEVAIINKGKIELAGAISELRSQSPHRYATIEFDGDIGPIVMPPIAGARVLTATGRRVRLELDNHVSVAAILHASSAVGTIAEFRYEAPTLSEVFLEAVA